VRAPDAAVDPTAHDVMVRNTGVARIGEAGRPRGSETDEPLADGKQRRSRPGVAGSVNVGSAVQEDLAGRNWEQSIQFVDERPPW